MSLFLNKRNLQGLTGGTITLKQPDGSAYSGYVSPNLQGLEVAHKATSDKVANQSGNTGAIIITDEYLEVTFDFIPEGTSLANALASARIPQPGSTAVIAGLPVIPMGTFTDGLNASSWIYEADAGVNGKAKEHWDGKITLRRYVDITAPAAIA